MSILFISASISSFFSGLFGVNWEDIDAKIDRKYPAVEFISSAQLLDLYQAEELPVIVDVREADEFEISHLGNALNLKTGDEIAVRFADKDTPLVVYCSVGYRSAGVAAELEQLGYTNVRNLRHSIFEWANNAYPLVNSQGDTDRVHPYNPAWGSLVEESLHQYPD